MKIKPYKVLMPRMFKMKIMSMTKDSVKNYVCLILNLRTGVPGKVHVLRALHETASVLIPTDFNG